MVSSSLDDLNGDVVAEILLRLPSESVLRCRAVCRAWRSITSSPAFVAAYSRRWPPELVVQRQGANGELDTIPLPTLDDDDDDEAAASRRCLDPGYPSNDDEYTLMACCGDLLLFEGGRRRDEPELPCVWVCSPVRRQWSAVALPHRNGLTVPCALYLHRPSGEHRLLFFANDTWDDITGPASHYVGSLAAAAAAAAETETETAAAAAAAAYRRLGPASAPVHILRQGITPGLDYRGKLHWLDHPEVRDSSDMILAFDTVSETFRRTMMPPSLLDTKQYGEAPLLSLLVMAGRLAMAATPDHGSGTGLGLRMDLWVLEDYDSDDSWRCRHRIDLSALSLPAPVLCPWSWPCCWAMDASASALLGLGHSSSNDDDDVILLGDMASLSVVLYHLTEKRVLKRTQVFVPPKSGRCTHMSPFVFRDSRETHGFFHRHKQPSDG